MHVIVHFYQSLKSSSGNLGPNVSISSQDHAAWKWKQVDISEHKVTKVDTNGDK
jgi:hypothetical protein